MVLEFATKSHYSVGVTTALRPVRRSQGADGSVDALG